jgi:hypothetical protein
MNRRAAKSAKSRKYAKIRDCSLMSEIHRNETNYAIRNNNSQRIFLARLGGLLSSARELGRSIFFPVN